ncbi:uncharacterized protein LOC129779814 [Toxorhynchites rutilus septentrionalis]|uniref:uncharacterized protein LOC129779814 n=1 Tax=Toxorhynchites rutilus septentrionalis TaxID=329112 RepID=UPI0024789335|nr:uncharacterized protein LOC129779814 [Toxorhynchites rutilus septentrionalis]
MGDRKHLPLGALRQGQISSVTQSGWVIMFPPDPRANMRQAYLNYSALACCSDLQWRRLLGSQDALWLLFPLLAETVAWIDETWRTTHLSLIGIIFSSATVGVLPKELRRKTLTESIMYCCQKVSNAVDGRQTENSLNCADKVRFTLPKTCALFKCCKPLLASSWQGGLRSSLGIATWKPRIRLPICEGPGNI